MNEVALSEIAVNLKAEQTVSPICSSAKFCKNLYCKHRLDQLNQANEREIEKRLANFTSIER